MPLAARAVQQDGGSGFEAAPEASCEKHGLKLFVLPPRSSKVNGHVERAYTTHTEAYYEVCDRDLDVTSLDTALRKREEYSDRRRVT